MNHIGINGNSNDTIKQRRTCYGHAVLLGQRQSKKGQFHVYWGPGHQHLADYFTKHHSPTDHKWMREMYIHASVRPMNRSGIQDSALRGCVNTQGMAGSNFTHIPCGR
jgi:hypothetical protein